MNKTTSYLAAALMGAALLAPAAGAFAHDRDWGGRGEWHEDHGWHHGHHKHDRGFVYYGAPAVVYQPYYAPPPPPVVYQPYYGYREPAVTIGVSIPPLVIPLR